MTVKDLRDILSALPDDAEVRLMHQPNWPFEYSVAGTCTDADLAREDESESTDDDDDDDDGEPKVVYLVEGSQLGYGDKHAWNLAR